MLILNLVDERVWKPTYTLKARLWRTKIRVGHQKEHLQFRQHTDVRPVTLSLKHKEQDRWNELSYIVGCARFFLGLPGFAYRLLIWAAVLCSNRFPSCSFGLHTWQIHIPGGGPGKKKREREEQKREAFQGWFIMSAAVTLFRYVFVVLSRDDPLCFSLYLHNL